MNFSTATEEEENLISKEIYSLVIVDNVHVSAVRKNCR